MNTPLTPLRQETTTMTGQQTYATIMQEPSAMVRKFKLMKTFHDLLPADAHTLSAMTIAAHVQRALAEKGVAYVTPLECGSRKTGYYTAFMVYVGGEPNPHTGPLASREEADALATTLNRLR